MEFLQLLYLNKKKNIIKTFILVFIMEIYCMKCKQKTMTSNLENVKSTNNRVRVKGTCAICHSKKSQFITVKTGSGFLNNVIGKLGDLGVELHLASEKGE